MTEYIIYEVSEAMKYILASITLIQYSIAAVSFLTDHITPAVGFGIYLILAIAISLLMYGNKETSNNVVTHRK